MSAQEYAELNPPMTPEKIQQFIKWLKKHGLESFEVEIMVDRYAYGKTLLEICEDRGYTGVSTVHQLYKKAEAKVKANLTRARKP